MAPPSFSMWAHHRTQQFSPSRQAEETRGSAEGDGGGFAASAALSAKGQSGLVFKYQAVSFILGVAPKLETNPHIVPWPFARP